MQADSVEEEQETKTMDRQRVKIVLSALCKPGSIHLNKTIQSGQVLLKYSDQVTRGTFQWHSTAL